jgi:ribosomal protein S18 acetylase RimI-like enzyme
MTEHGVRAYDPDTDRAALWELKRRFERELGAGGGPEKSATYEAKLDDDYRDRYLDWVDRCVRDEDCVFVADARGDEDALGGYVFVLPERLAMVWDAAVVNEVYVRVGRRGSGLADALFERGLQHARDQSLPMDRVVLDVDRENRRARAFYDRHGFDHWAEMVAREL